MKNILLFIFLFFFNLKSNSIAVNKQCDEFKKLSVDYLKCKGNLIKEKTISKGQNVIQDTKDYQNKEWSKDKKKINKAKDKINEVKEKILN